MLRNLEPGPLSGHIVMTTMMCLGKGKGEIIVILPVLIRCLCGTRSPLVPRSVYKDQRLGHHWQLMDGQAFVSKMVGLLKT